MSQPLFSLSPTIALCLLGFFCCPWCFSNRGGLEATSAALHGSGSSLGKEREQECLNLNPICH